MPRLWVCTACGRTSHDPYSFRDESCMLNAVEVVPSSIVRNAAGLVVSADPVVRDKIEMSSVLKKDKP